MRLFVYGTLLSGEPNHTVLRGASCLGPARTATAYELVDLGPFPAMVSGGAHAVTGELYSVGPELLPELDAFEGHPVFYRRVPVRLDDGSVAEAYVLHPEQTGGLPRIASGDWRLRKKIRHRSD